ncbi:MAG: 50S ribosomal protein L2 [Gammaproteobacteria bacterium]
MALIKSKPRTPGQRGMVRVKTPGLHKGAPHAPLVCKKPAAAGRNNSGRITAWHRGGGHRQRYRILDFRRDKDGIPAKVERLEYDPNRSAHLALLLYADGERRYIIAPQGVAVGDRIESGADAPVRPGNAKPLAAIPVGVTVHCVELNPGRGAQLARSAGISAQFVALDGDYAMLRLKSGETRRVRSSCRAVIGAVGNEEHFLRKLGKAGASRWRGRRPHVRGMVMNPVDHPMGGGEGRSKSNKIPVSPWGQPAKGYRTRRNKRTDKWIVARRRARKGR